MTEVSEACIEHSKNPLNLEMDDENVKTRQVRIHWGKNEVYQIEENEDDENWSDFEDIADDLADESGDFTKKLNAARMSYPQVSYFAEF
uniref:Uncharacterized protein n=1 Tax=Panagrolaimus superbus TaxID=310955 RepID=A0A914Z7C6_9BILA